MVTSDIKKPPEGGYKRATTPIKLAAYRGIEPRTN